MIKYAMIAMLDTRLIIDGILYSPNDCRIPTNENARPVNIIIGNIIDVSDTASSCVCASKFGAINDTSGSAKIIPTAEIISVMSIIIVMNLFAKPVAFSRSFFVRISLKIGIKLAEITPPITISKSVVGSFDAAINASASMPIPKFAPISESRTSPSAFDMNVANAINPAVRSIFLPDSLLLKLYTSFFV